MKNPGDAPVATTQSHMIICWDHFWAGLYIFERLRNLDDEDDCQNSEQKKD